MVNVTRIFKRPARGEPRLPSLPRQTHSTTASSGQSRKSPSSWSQHAPVAPPLPPVLLAAPPSPSTASKRRKTPDQYRQNVLAVSSPSQLSLSTLTEYYEAPDGQNGQAVASEIFRSRGYKKLNKIDEGAFGVVSRGQRLSDMNLVAIKEVDLRRKRIKRIEEMKRELFVLQKIEHPNVVRMYEHFIIGQQLVIIMEFCAGGNMTTYLKEKSITESEAIGLFKQMAISIKALHRRGITHRDVKLNNFLLDATRSKVKIADFGLSIVSYRRKYGVFLAKTYCGTEPYMAPELIKRNSLGLRQYNPFCADVWSLGVCLFAMLTRSFPFKVQASQPELLKAQVSRKWKFPRGFKGVLSEEVKDLIWHMLDPEEQRRITINGLLAHRWFHGNQHLNLSLDDADSSPLKKTSSRSSARSKYVPAGGAATA